MEEVTKIITLPTEAELRDTLTGLERLISAKEWERAAIVYAFTTNDGPGRPKNPAEVQDFPVPVTGFAAIGFHGLRNFRTVARYRKVWADAIARGTATEVRPGDEVVLPTDPWNDFYDPTEGDPRYNIPAADDLRAQAKQDGTGLSKVVDIAKNTAAMESAIMADPRVAQAAELALQRLDDQARRKARAQQEDFELGVIADGGRIPSVEEIKERRADHPVEAAIRAVDDEERRLGAPIRRIEEAIAAFTESVGENTHFADRLRKCSLDLLDKIATARVQS